MHSRTLLSTSSTTDQTPEPLQHMSTQASLAPHQNRYNYRMHKTQLISSSHVSRTRSVSIATLFCAVPFLVRAFHNFSPDFPGLSNHTCSHSEARVAAAAFTLPPGLLATVLTLPAVFQRLHPLAPTTGLGVASRISSGCTPRISSPGPLVIAATVSTTAASGAHAPQRLA